MGKQLEEEEEEEDDLVVDHLQMNETDESWHFLTFDKLLWNRTNDIKAEAIRWLTED